MPVGGRPRTGSCQPSGPRIAAIRTLDGRPAVRTNSGCHVSPIVPDAEPPGRTGVERTHRDSDEL
jgi:hypothetical protein